MSETVLRRRSAALGIGLQAATRRAFEVLSPDCDLIEASGAADAIALLRLRAYQAIFVDGDSPGLSPGDMDALRTAAPEIPKVLVGMTKHADFFGSLADTHLRFLPVDLPSSLFALEALRILKPRTSERRPLDEGCSTTGTLEGRAFSYALLDLSNRGLSFAVPSGDAVSGFIPGHPVSALRIVDREGQLKLVQDGAVVRHVRQDTVAGLPVTRIGLSFEAPPPPRSPFIRIVSEPLAILATLRKSCRARRAFTVAPPDSESIWEFTESEVAFDPRPVLRLASDRPPEIQARDVVRLSFSHHGLSYSGLASVVDEPGLALAIPRTLRVHHRRGSNRHRPPPTRPYTVRLRASLIGLDETFPVHDLNATGLSAIIDGDRDLLPAGLVLDEVELFAPGQTTPVRARGIVRSLGALPRRREGGEAAPTRCGIELTDLDGPAHAKLCQSLVGEGFPHVDVADPGDFDEIWKFMREAGFTFHLYGDGSPQSEAVARHAFEAVLGKGRGAAVSLLFRSEGVLCGHISGLQLYSRTWIATHLAALQSGAAPASDRISRALCLGISEHLENQPSGEYVKLMWKKDQRWANRMFGWVGRAIHHPGLTEAREFPVLVRAASVPLTAPDAAVQVRDAAPAELDQIARHFALTAGAVRIRSDDLDRDGLLLGRVESIYAGIGLHRRRRVRVAVLDGHVAGFSLQEDTTAGLQLAEITNGFDATTFPELDPRADVLVRQALISDGIAFAAARGLSHAVALPEAPDLSAFLEAGFVVAGIARSWTVHRSLVRSWADVWDQIFTHKGDYFATSAQVG